MKTLTAKATSAIAGGIVLLAGAAFAGLGLTVLGVLALFALAATVLALIASPFVNRAMKDAVANGHADA